MRHLLIGRVRGLSACHSWAMTDRAARTETQSIETGAQVAVILAVLTDPTRIPEWAPAFADAVRGDAHSGWQATKDGREFALRIAINRGPARWTSCARSVRAKWAAPISGSSPGPEAAASSP
jgi:hypothetical protein